MYAQNVSINDPWIDFQITSVAVRQRRADEMIGSMLAARRKQLAEEAAAAEAQAIATREMIRERLSLDERAERKAGRRCAFQRSQR
jgi:hypothetical protein